MRGRGREGGKRKPVVSASQIYIDTMWVNRYMDTVWLKRYCVGTDIQCGYRDTVVCVGTEIQSGYRVS